MAKPSSLQLRLEGRHLAVWLTPRISWLNRATAHFPGSVRRTRHSAHIQLDLDLPFPIGGTPATLVSLGLYSAARPSMRTSTECSGTSLLPYLSAA